MPAEVLEALQAAIATLDTGEVEGARARLMALAATLRKMGHAGDEHGV